MPIGLDTPFLFFSTALKTYQAAGLDLQKKSFKYLIIIIEIRTIFFFVIKRILRKIIVFFCSRFALVVFFKEKILPLFRNLPIPPPNTMSEIQTK